jgi:uncharacterized repeat protein (TIGR01451 family)
VTARPRQSKRMGLAMVIAALAALTVTTPVLAGVSTQPVVKTVATSFDRTYDWNITKTVVSDSKITTADNTATFRYKVDVTKLPPVDSNIKVSGTITVVLPSQVPQEVFIEDDILGRTDETCTVGGANLAGTWTIPAGTAVSFDYVCTLPTTVNGTNRVTVSTPFENTLPLPGAFIASFDAPFTFGVPTKVTNNSVDVTDAFNGATPPGALLAGGDDLTASKNFDVYSRTVNVPSSGCTTYPNTAYITSPDGLSKTAPASVQACRAASPNAVSPPPPAPSAAATGAVAPRARLRVTKTGPRAATAGQIVTYTITVRNTGRVSAAAVVLRDLLPSGFRVSGKVKGATFARGTLSWRVGALAPGKSRTVKASFRINRSIGGRRCNVASASARGVAAVRATACTRIAAVAGAVEPAVTG